MYMQQHDMLNISTNHCYCQLHLDHLHSLPHKVNRNITYSIKQ